MNEKWLQTLVKSPLFNRIEVAELNSMLQCLKPRVRTFNKHEIISVEGEYLKEIGILLSGSVAVTKENVHGTRVIMTVITPPHMFGEIAAFSHIKAWPATVIAQDLTEVMFLLPEKLVSSCKNSCSSHRRLVYNILAIISDRALMLNKKVEYVTIKSVRGKISAFLLDQHKLSRSKTFLLPMKRGELAEFLNISRPSLSREMCRMRDEGLIEFHQSSVKILNIEGLKE